MQEKCETVIIETKAGPVTINKSDLKKDDVLVGSKSKSEKSAKKKTK
jgi:hypothetical protein